MSTDSTAHTSTTGQIEHFRDVIEHDGHAWVLAHDTGDWFYECLRCGDRVHVLSIDKMNKAIEHHYAYMPLSHRAPWNQAKPRMVLQPTGELAEEQAPPYPACTEANAPLPDLSGLRQGPVVAVAQN